MSKPKTAPQKQSKLPYGSMIILAGLAFATYANSLSNGFIGDDKEQLLQNPVVFGHQVTAAFTSGVWAFRGFRGNYYRPLQFEVYMLQHSLFGFQAFGFHLTMVLLHILNTILLYYLTLQMIPRGRVAVATAALFAIHPIHTEAVDWIAALPDLLTTTIVVFAVWCFARDTAAPRGRRIALHCGLYGAALLSKETGFMLLPLYVAFEWVFVGRPLRDLRKNNRLYGAMVSTFGAYLVIRCLALGGLAPGQETFYHLSPAEFLLSATVTATRYASEMILPLHLNYFHVFHPTRSLTVAFAISLFVLGGIATAAFHQSIPSSVRFGVWWMVLTLAPALNLAGVGQNVFTERYLYLPSVGFAWIMGLAWEWWAARQLRAAWAAGIAILLAGAWEAVARNADWRDDLTLLQKTVVQSPDAAILHNNLAGVYVSRNDLDHALEQERLAVTLEPHSAPFHKNLGLLLMARDPRAAVPELEEALRLQPGAADLPPLLNEARAAAARQ